MSRSELDWADKLRDLEYENFQIKTKESWRKFIKQTKATRLLGGVARMLIKVKHHFGLNNYFTPQCVPIPDFSNSVHLNDNTVMETSQEGSLDNSEKSSRWQVEVISKVLPDMTRNCIGECCFKKKKNLKT